MKCFIYCRKSSEDQSRQIQSIDDQKRILKELARQRKLIVEDVFIDEKSAGKPYQRPGFQKMIQEVNLSETSIILSWKIDRLSRNPIENGQISWMLQQGIIHEIITPERSYLPEDNVLLFMIEGAMANQYIRDLSTNVKRGMNSKVKKGIFPGFAPLGYLNDGKQKGSKQIVPDPIYYQRIKALWDLLKTGHYQLADLYRLMLEKYPLYRRGKILAFSSFHRIFHNPFYCGLFRWQGELQLGSHKTMLSQSEFEQIQSFLGKENKTRVKVLEFDYKGVFKCGECNACITAERKHKFIKSKNCNKTFDYYRCTHNKRHFECHEKPISLQKLELQILKEIDEFYLPNEIIEYGIERLIKEKVNEHNLQVGSANHIDTEIRVLEKSIKKIEENIVMESDTEIRHMMKQKHTELKIQIKKMNEDLESIKKQSKNWINKIIEELLVIRDSKKILLKGTKPQKQRLLHNMGLNWILKGRIISYEPNFVLRSVQKVRNLKIPEKGRLEPLKTCLSRGENLSLEQVAFVWSTLWELIRNSERSFL